MEAKAAHRGLWSIPETQIVPPWEWRRGARGPPPSPDGKRVEPLPFASTGAETDADHCGTNRYCREMVTCAEAKFYLR